MDEQDNQGEFEKAEARLNEALRREARRRDWRARRRHIWRDYRWIAAWLVVVSALIGFINPHASPPVRLGRLIVLPTAFLLFLYYSWEYFTSRRGEGAPSAGPADGSAAFRRRRARRVAFFTLFTGSGLLLVLLLAWGVHRQAGIPRAAAGRSLLAKRLVTYTQDNISTTVEEVVLPEWHFHKQRFRDR